MGITRIVHVVNRTTGPLEVMDDGQPWPIRPGYKRLEDGTITGAGPNGEVATEALPFFAAERAIRQNPVMGTNDPYNPRAFESLVAVPDWGQDYSHREQSDAVELLDRSQLPVDAQAATAFAVRGGRKPNIPGKPAPKQDPSAGRGNVEYQPTIANPTGMRMDY